MDLKEKGLKIEKQQVKELGELVDKVKEYLSRRKLKIEEQQIKELGELVDKVKDYISKGFKK